MAGVDKEFNLLCNAIKTKGREYENKNRGVKRNQIPSYTFKHDFSDGFPAITNKQLPFKFIKGELIWFLRGDTNVKYLVDNGIPIWNKDAYNLYVKVASGNHGKEANNIYFVNEDGTSRMLLIDEFVSVVKGCVSMKHLKDAFSFKDYTIGDVGRNYSAQWRDFQGDAISMNEDRSEFIYERHDQIKEIIEGMKKDIMSSRLIVNAWNPAELDKTALPPCHDKFQVIGVPLVIEERVGLLMKKDLNLFSAEFKKECTVTDKEEGVVAVGIEASQKECDRMNIPEFGFELHWNQRSVDTFLGLPFNIASYALLAKIFEEVTEYPALSIEGALKCVHFYDNQYEAVDEMMSRDIDGHENCELLVNSDFKMLCKAFRNGVVNIDELFGEMTIDMFKLDGYTSDEAINVEMLAPIKL